MNERPMDHTTRRTTWIGRQGWVLLACLLIGLCQPTGVLAADEGAEEASEVKAVPKSVEDLAAIEARVAKVIEQATPATVCVRAGGGSGSGVIISEDGYVLTAGHVAMEPGRSVTFIFPDGKTARGKSLGVNVIMDAGLMKITDEGKWPYVEMGEIESVKAGAWVVAMGHPGGFDKDRPIVARLGRVFRVGSSVIRSDCTIIGGDSGGPLFDLDGKVVGIHSRISDGLRDNYHVPISLYQSDWQRLAAGEMWNRPLAGAGVRPGGPLIGVQGEDRFEPGRGAKLARVYAKSPAEQAGLKAGDVVIEFDRSPIGSFGDLAAIVGRMEPGDKATIVIERDGNRIELEIVIGKATGDE